MNVTLILIEACLFLITLKLHLFMFMIYLEAPPRRDFIKENVKNLRLMQQNNQYINQYERKGQLQRKVRSTSHSRLCSSTNSVKHIRSSKSNENGE